MKTTGKLPGLVPTFSDSVKSRRKVSLRFNIQENVINLPIFSQQPYKCVTGSIYRNNIHLDVPVITIVLAFYRIFRTFKQI